MAMTEQEQMNFLASLGLGDEPQEVDIPTNEEAGQTVDEIEIDWSLIDGLSLTAKPDWEAAYRIIFDANKRSRHTNPGWNKALHGRIVNELNARKAASKTGYVKEKVKAGNTQRAANIAKDVATILAAAGVEIDESALDAAISQFVEGE